MGAGFVISDGGWTGRLQRFIVDPGTRRGRNLKKRLIWIGAIAAAVGLLALAIWLGLTIAERGYQNGATNKRINDTHRIAEAIEVFRRETGALPYAAAGRPPGHEDLPVVVRIVSPASDGRLAFGPPPFQLESFVDVPGPRFSARLSEANRAPVRIPVDPQRVSNGRPNAYYVIFPASGGYAVMSFLARDVAGSTKVQRGVHIYAVGKDWPAGFMPGLPIRPIPTGSLSESERQEIARLGAAADERFGRHTVITIEGEFAPQTSEASGAASQSVPRGATTTGM
jgi:hypothetical protein